MFSPIILIGTILFAYFVQKRCRPGHLRFRGKKLELPQKLVAYDIMQVSVKNGKYYADGCIRETGEVARIEIDSDVMEHISAVETQEGPLLHVMVYEETNGFSLAEEELRYKIGINVVDDSTTTRIEIDYAEYVIWFLYEIRNILLTIAAIGVYRSPHISIFFSLLAFVIQARNVIPLRFTKLTKHGIIEATKEVKSSTKESEYPPGYDVWSDNQKFLYQANQRMQANEQNQATNELHEQEVDDANGPADINATLLATDSFDAGEQELDDFPDVDKMLLVKEAEPIPEEDDEFDAFVPPEDAYLIETSEKLECDEFEPDSDDEFEIGSIPKPIPAKESFGKSSQIPGSSDAKDSSNFQLPVVSFFQQGQRTLIQDPEKEKEPAKAEEKAAKEKSSHSHGVTKKFVHQPDPYANQQTSTTEKKNKLESPRQPNRPIQQKKSTNAYNVNLPSAKTDSSPKEPSKKRNKNRQRNQKAEANTVTKLAGENRE